MSATDYCVYRLRCPATKSVKYIGITKNTHMRIYDHCSCPKEVSRDMLTRKQRWVRMLRKYGLRPIIEIIITGLTKQNALAAERYLVQAYSLSYPNQLVNGEPWAGTWKPMRPWWTQAFDVEGIMDEEATYSAPGRCGGPRTPTP